MTEISLDLHRLKFKSIFIATYLVQQERICHGSFSKVVKSITSFYQKVLKAIDYASSILMYDTINLLWLIAK